VRARDWEERTSGVATGVCGAVVGVVILRRGGGGQAARLGKGGGKGTTNGDHANVTESRTKAFMPGI
jgi:hypothetical protein